jgi:hypothetical protein
MSSSRKQLEGNSIRRYSDADHLRIVDICKNVCKFAGYAEVQLAGCGPPSPCMLQLPEQIQGLGVANTITSIPSLRPHVSLASMTTHCKHR